MQKIWFQTISLIKENLNADFVIRSVKKRLQHTELVITMPDYYNTVRDFDDKTK